MSSPISFEVTPQNIRSVEGSPSFKSSPIIEAVDGLSGSLSIDPLSDDLGTREIRPLGRTQKEEDLLPTQKELSEILKNLIEDEGIDISDESSVSITTVLGNGTYDLETFHFNNDKETYLKIDATYQISYKNSQGMTETKTLTRPIYTNIKSTLEEEERDVLLSKLTASYTAFVIDFAKASNGLSSTMDKKTKWDDFKDVSTFSFSFSKGSEKVRSYPLLATSSSSQASIPLIDFKISKKFYEIDHITKQNKEIEESKFKQKQGKPSLYKEIVEKPFHEIVRSFSLKSSREEEKSEELNTIKGRILDPKQNENLKKEIEEKKQKLEDLKKEIQQEISDLDQIEYDKKIIESWRKKKALPERQRFISSSSFESEEDIERRRAQTAEFFKIDEKLASAPMQKLLVYQSQFRGLVELLQKNENLSEEEKQFLTTIQQNCKEKIDNKSIEALQEFIKNTPALNSGDYNLTDMSSILEEHSDSKNALYKYHQERAEKIKECKSSIKEKEKIEKELSDLQNQVSTLVDATDDRQEKTSYTAILNILRKKMH